MSFPNATLHELEIFTPDPAALARFYSRALRLEASGSEADMSCSAPGRRLRFVRGPAGQLRAATFRCGTPGDFEHLRAALRERSTSFEEDGKDGFAVRDPEGHLLRFVARTAAEAADPAEAAHARLQHFAVRTPDPEQLLAFYTGTMGFLLSDRVEDETGRLTAAFIRCDEEHHTLAIFRAAQASFDHLSCETDDWNALRDWADHMAAAEIQLAWGIGRHGPGDDTFFMVRDEDGNMAEVSAELEVCAPSRPAGLWPHRPTTLNRWGVAIMRS